MAKMGEGVLTEDRIVLRAGPEVSLIQSRGDVEPATENE